MSDDSPASSRAPWPHRGAIPHRYFGNYQRYQALGGLAEVTEDAAAFAGAEPFGDIARFMFFCLAFDQIHKEGVEGDFAELGVYQGSTAAVLARQARRLNRRLYLMDTFEGFDRRDLSDRGLRRAALSSLMRRSMPFELAWARPTPSIHQGSFSDDCRSTTRK